MAGSGFPPSLLNPSYIRSLTRPVPCLPQWLFVAIMRIPLFLAAVSLACLRAQTITAVVNAASYSNSPVAPGEIVTLFGTSLGPDRLTTGNLGTSLAGVQVLFDGSPAPLLYVSSTQISAITPFGLTGKNSTQVQVTFKGITSMPLAKFVVDAAPGIFSAAASGKGLAASTNSDGSLNSLLNPAAPGSYVTFYMTGSGRLSPAASDGSVATGIARAVLPSSVTIAGKTAEVLYVGAAPGIVNGFTQVNAIIPRDVMGGEVPLTIQVGDSISPTGVTLAVAGPRSGPTTVFLIHGLGQGFQGIQALLGSLNGLDPARLRFDAGFDFSECSATTSCAANCTISTGGDKLAQYILRAKPPGDIALLGFSMGGLLARDVIANNRLASLNGGKVSALITLGSPNLGYPYSTFDRLLYCNTLVQQMEGNWRAQQSSNTAVLSSYLSAVTNQWKSASVPDVWLAASGRSCSNAARTINPGTGCRDKNPFSDGIVCDDSASYFGATGGPTILWQDPGQVYVHSNSGVGSIGSSFILCGNNGQNPALSNPPVFGPLFDEIKKVLLGLPATLNVALPAARNVLQWTDAEQRDFVLSAMNAGFPVSMADEMSLLLLNRPQLVVPLLEAGIVKALTESPHRVDWIATAGEMIAYSGSTESLQAIGRLILLDKAKFSRLVRRTVDNKLANGRQQ